MKFTLTMENGDHKITHTFESTKLDEFHEYEKDFLKGCGFILKEDGEND